jgi:hypothetical protein
MKNADFVAEKVAIANHPAYNIKVYKSCQSPAGKTFGLSGLPFGG